MVTYAVFFALMFGVFIGTAFLLAKGHTSVLSSGRTTMVSASPSSSSLPTSSQGNSLPAIPRTAQEAYDQLTNDDFELFSAAIIIAQSHGGYRFLRRVGGAGDGGIDVILRNVHNNNVLVQCKRYAGSIEPSLIRDFHGVITLQQNTAAYYGFFVTTSWLTKQSQQTVQQSGRIHVINGWDLDTLLDYHYQEIAMEYHKIRAGLQQVNK